MQIKTAVFADDGTFPNSRLPLVLYIDVMPEATTDGLEGLFGRNGWPPAWRASVFPYHHYHSRSHECLGVAQGRARLQFGGPAGQAFEVKAGDVVVIPAGVAHQRLDASADFLVVGCYPPGQQNWDIVKGLDGERPDADRNIAAVPLPRTDPVEGFAGSLPRLWKAAD